jgi:predicted Zn-dependent protease
MIQRVYRTFTPGWHHTMHDLAVRTVCGYFANVMQRNNFKKKQPLALLLKAYKAILLGAICGLLPLSLTAQPNPSSESPGSTAPALPLLGDSSDMSSNAERNLGDRIARELYRDPDYLDDPVLGDYVQGVWQPLLAAARQRGDLTPELDERFAWQILLGRDRTVNAFALPGGYLGVHLGLLAVVSSRDELASVLGHEMSHVTQRHISRLMSKNSQQTPWMIGAMILGALAASKSPDAANALIVGGQAVSAQNQLNFSRDMEREADRVGFGVMTQAGFEPLGFVTMFDKLQQASRLNDNGGYPYLRSHPLTTERIADMQSRLPLGTPHNPDVVVTMLHAMMAARARVLSNPGVDALRTWQVQANDPKLLAKTPAEQAGVLYGATLAASQLRETAQARQHWQRLHSLTAADTQATQQVQWLRAEIGLAARDLNRQQLLNLSSDIAPPAATIVRRPELLLQAQLAQQAGQDALLNNAAQRLQTWVASHPQDALAWQELASVYGAQNQILRALRAEAEVQVARLDYPAALDRLKAAQDQSHTAPNTSAGHIDASIIDTRRRQIEALLKQQTLDRGVDH